MPGPEQVKEAALAVDEERNKKQAADARSGSGEQLKDKQIEGKAKEVAQEEAAKAVPAVQETPEEAAKNAEERARIGQLDPNSIEPTPGGTGSLQDGQGVKAAQPIEPVILKPSAEEPRLPPVTPEAAAQAATATKQTDPVVPVARQEAQKDEKKLNPNDAKTAEAAAAQAAAAEAARKAAELKAAEGEKSKATIFSGSGDSGNKEGGIFTDKRPKEETPKPAPFAGNKDSRDEAVPERVRIPSPQKPDPTPNVERRETAPSPPEGEKGAAGKTHGPDRRPDEKRPDPEKRVEPERRVEEKRVEPERRLDSDKRAEQDQRGRTEDSKREPAARSQERQNEQQPQQREIERKVPDQRREAEKPQQEAPPRKDTDNRQIESRPEAPRTSKGEVNQPERRVEDQKTIPERRVEGEKPQRVAEDRKAETAPREVQPKDVKPTPQEAPSKGASERRTEQRTDQVREVEKGERKPAVSEVKGGQAEDESRIPKGRITERVKDRLEEAPVVREVVKNDAEIKNAVTVTTSSTGGDGDAGAQKGKGEISAERSHTKEDIKAAFEQIKDALEKGMPVDPKLLEIIQQAHADAKAAEKPALPIEIAKSIEEVVTPQLTKQEAMQALLGLLVDAERMSNVLVSEIKVDTETKLGQIQANIDEVLKLRVEQFIALSVNQHGIEGVDLQHLLHESLNELATRYGLTEEQRILLGRIMVAVSSASFEQDELLIKQKPEDTKEIDQAKLKLKLQEELRLREATPEEIEKFRKEELEELKRLLKERDELRREEAEKKLKELIELSKAEEEVTFMIDEDLEVIKTYKIVGIVIDRETNKPIPGIPIMGGLLGTKTTDAKGIFSYENVPQGTLFMIGPDSIAYSFKPPFIAGTVTMGVHLEFRAKLKVQ